MQSPGTAWSTPRLSELLKNPVYCRADRQIYDFFRAQGTEVINPPADFIGRNGCYLFRGDSANKRADLQGARLVLAPHEGWWTARYGWPAAGSCWQTGRPPCRPPEKVHGCAGVSDARPAAGR